MLKYSIIQTGSNTLIESNIPFLVSKLWSCLLVYSEALKTLLPGRLSVIAIWSNYCSTKPTLIRLDRLKPMIRLEFKSITIAR